MTDSDVLRLATAAGLAPNWRDAAGNDRVVTIEALRAVLDKLPPADHPVRPTLITAEAGETVTFAGRPGPARLAAQQGGTTETVLAEAANGTVQLAVPSAPGYYQIETGGTEVSLAVAPPRCLKPSDVAPDTALWGLAVQLYSLRRPGSDVGDFAALAEFAAAAAKAGAGAIAISPVHAAFAADPGHFSPYAPSSRALLNGLFADPGAPSDADAGELVDWKAVAAERWPHLRQRFAQMAPGESQAFASFRFERGAVLERHARFEALQAAQLAADPGAWAWQGWPEALRDPASPAVEAFATGHADEVAFHAYVQFRADRDLGAAQAAARNHGMPVGLIADLAVGVDPSGSDAWSEPAQLLQGLSIGAPGDLLNPQGQGWGVTTFSPRGLMTHGYTAFINMLRSALRHAGGVRIDHVMGLARLWVIPDGAGPADGAYLHYPVHDLLRLVRLESHLHRAIVIGEDLGTLPDGFQGLLQSTALEGMRVLWFERDAQHFVPPRQWSSDAVGMTTTHDLPTVAGWWRGGDVAWQDRLGHGDAAAAGARAADRDRLWSAFQASGAADGPAPPIDDPEPVVDAACAHVGTAACGLVLLPIEDALGLVEQPNLPGTIDEHPNWRRRLPAAADELFARPAVAARLRALTRARARMEPPA